MINEKILIEHGSLTLSSLKTASLFAVKFDKKENLYKSIEFWNNKFLHRGIKIISLKVKHNSALIYLYRENMLKKDLEDSTAKNILSDYGYDGLNVNDLLKRLDERLCTYDEFPHEIGLFLGYPPEDVEGFICNGGKNCNLCRYWKVYGDTNKALKQFERYDKCRALYKKLWQEGKDILRLTVKKQVVA